MQVALIFVLSLIMLLIVNVVFRRHEQEIDHVSIQLKRRVSTLRLSKMLSYLHVDIDQYVTKIPVEDIHHHIKNCSHCRGLDVCDSCLRDGKIVHKMDFCPNYWSLIHHSKSFRK